MHINLHVYSEFIFANIQDNIMISIPVSGDTRALQLQSISHDQTARPRGYVQVSHAQLVVIMIFGQPRWDTIIESGHKAAL